MAYKFMPNLLSYGHYRGIVTEIRGTRISKYFNVLKRPVVLNQMERFFNRKLAVMRVRRTFKGFQLTRRHMQTARLFAEHKHLQAEDRLVKESFGKLKSYLYLKRCRRFALGGHAMQILAKSFSKLRKNAVKKIMARQAFQTLTRQRMRQFLDLWVSEYDKRTRGQHAESVRNFATTHQIIFAWKQYTDEMKVVNVFQSRWHAKELKQLSLYALKQNVAVRRYNQFATEQICERRQVG